MARIVEFPECNFVWKGWPAGDGRTEVLDMACYRDPEQTVSCWELTDEEREEVARTGKVWLHVLTQRHPPVLVTGLKPFK